MTEYEKFIQNKYKSALKMLIGFLLFLAMALFLVLSGLWAIKLYCWHSHPIGVHIFIFNPFVDVKPNPQNACLAASLERG